jgi:Flp pilus assembly protein TadD
MTARAIHLLLAAALLGATACATSEGASRPAAAPAAAPPTPPPADDGTLSPRAQRLFDEAVAALQDQRTAKVPTDWELLERKWRAAAEEGSSEAWFNVGVALEQQGKPGEARAAYERALARRPAFREAAVNLALLRAAGETPEAAAGIYAETLRRFPEDALLRVRLAELYLRSGQLDDAWRLAREALQRDPRAAGAYPVMMRVALARGDLDLAELVAVRARKLEPNDPEITFLLGTLHERRGEDAAALAQYRKASAQRPQDLQARYRLLSMAVQARAWEAAAEQARAILAVRPDDARVRLALGVSLRNLGKPDEAVVEYLRVRADAGRSLPEVDLDLGVAHMKGKGGCAAAIPELERYQSAVGPAVASETAAPVLLRECNQILAANRQAEEAARQMRTVDTKGPTPTEGPVQAAPGAPTAPR